MKKICYIQPAEDGISAETITITAQEAIEKQKSFAANFHMARPNFVYPDDQTALLDFIAIHWAWEVEE